MPPAYSPGVPLWTEGSTLSFSCEDELNSAKKEQELKPCTKFFYVIRLWPFSLADNMVESYQRTDFYRCSPHIDPQLWYVGTGVKLDQHRNKAEGIFL